MSAGYFFDLSMLYFFENRNLDSWDLKILKLSFQKSLSFVLTFFFLVITHLFLFLVMGKSILQELLVAISILLLSVVSLPIFFLFLWLTDTSKSISDLLFSPMILSGIGILFFSLYLGRMLFLFLKSIKA
jgi:hypothetical protein